MNQEEIAKQVMINWLSHPGELGRAPEQIECTKKFIYDELNYYIFKFKGNASDERWILGVCGGYEKNSEEYTGHVFSDRKEYIQETEENDAIEIIEMIKNYWKARAQQILEQEIENSKQN